MIKTEKYNTIQYESIRPKSNVELLMQISQNNSFCPLTLGLAHVKFDVWPKPYQYIFSTTQKESIISIKLKYY